MDLTELRSQLHPPGPVLDVHVHPFPGPGQEATLEEAVAYLLEHADRAGIFRMVLMNLGRPWQRSPDPDQFRAANDDCLKLRDLAPDRFLPFCYLNPAWPKESIAELTRCVKQHGMVGVKLWVAVRANDPRVREIAEFAVTLDVPILQHVWVKSTGNDPGESSPYDLVELAKGVPHARLIMGHMHGAGRKGVEAVAPYPNIVVETAGSNPERGAVEAAVRALGSRRVLFGSDATGRHFGTQLGKVLGTDLSELTKQRILWDNLARLLPVSAGVQPNDDDDPAPEDLRP